MPWEAVAQAILAVIAPFVLAWIWVWITEEPYEFEVPDSDPWPSSCARALQDDLDQS